MLASNSNIKRHEKTRLTMLKTSKVVSPVARRTLPSHVKIWTIKSAKMHETSRATSRRTE